MKTTKLFTLGAALFVLSVSLMPHVFAQTAPAPAPAAPTTAKGEHGKREDAIEKLHLTADQTAQIKTIRQDARKQVKAIKADTTLTPDQRKDKVKELHKDTMQKVLAVLTPAQKAELKEIRKAHKG